jgi:ABC-type antimicrobial peptide transport system permease subunit
LHFPETAAVTVQTYGELAGDRARTWRLGTRLLSLFGLGGVTLVAIGLYASLAASIRRQEREIGLRMALGARRAQVVLSVVAHAGLLALGGIILGIGGIAVTMPFTRDLTFGVAVLDPLALFTAAAIVVLAAGAGSIVPAFRVAAIDPAAALRK